MMKGLLIPKRILDWINTNRGSRSQQAFIIDCLFYMMKNGQLPDNKQSDRQD